MARKFIAGHDFAGQTGLKTGQELEDLVEEAVPTTEVTDDTTITVVSNKLQVKSGGIGQTQIDGGLLLQVDTGTITPTSGGTTPAIWSAGYQSSVAYTRIIFFSALVDQGSGTFEVAGFIKDSGGTETELVEGYVAGTTEQTVYITLVVPANYEWKIEPVSVANLNGVAYWQMCEVGFK